MWLIVKIRQYCSWIWRAANTFISNVRRMTLSDKSLRFLFHLIANLSKSTTTMPYLIWVISPSTITHPYFQPYGSNLEEEEDCVSSYQSIIPIVNVIAPMSTALTHQRESSLDSSSVFSSSVEQDGQGTRSPSIIYVSKVYGCFHEWEFIASNMSATGMDNNRSLMLFGEIFR